MRMDKLKLHCSNMDFFEILLTSETIFSLTNIMLSDKSEYMLYDSICIKFKSDKTDLRG